MLTVKENKDRGRTPYFVELEDFGCGGSLYNSNRLGYWCDKVHLQEILKDLGALFSREEIAELFGLDKPEAKYKIGDVVSSYEFSGTVRDIRWNAQKGQYLYLLTGCAYIGPTQTITVTEDRINVKY